MKKPTIKMYPVVFVILYSLNAFSWGISIPTPGQIVEKAKETVNNAVNTTTQAASSAANAVTETAKTVVEKTVEVIQKPGETIEHVANEAEKIVKQPEKMASVFAADQVAFLKNLLNSTSAQSPFNLDQSIYGLAPRLVEIRKLSGDLFYATSSIPS